MSFRRLALVAVAAAILPLGPYDIILLNTAKTPTAKGTARLVWAQSPFGVTVTADGRARYEGQLSLTGLPEPASLGPYSTYVAWAATTNLDKWYRLGAVKNGSSKGFHRISLSDEGAVAALWRRHQPADKP